MHLLLQSRGIKVQVETIQNFFYTSIWPFIRMQGSWDFKICEDLEELNEAPYQLLAWQLAWLGNLPHLQSELLWTLGSRCSQPDWASLGP